jgi:hypothetical protein
MKRPDRSLPTEVDSPLTGPVDRAQLEPKQADPSNANDVLSGIKQEPTRQFAGIVAHSLNNLLTSIIGYTNLAWIPMLVF